MTIPEVVMPEEGMKSERINITLPRYLKALADQAGLSPSKVLQESLLKKLFFNQG